MTDKEVLFEAWYFTNNPSLPFIVRKALKLEDGDKYRFVRKNNEVIIEKDGKNYFIK